MIPTRSDAQFRLAASLERALAGSEVRVGTQNRAKLDAVATALAELAPSEEASPAISLVPVSVPSGVPEQPIGFDQIISGARNRARAALSSGPGAALAIGIEDGLIALVLPGEGGLNESAEQSVVYNVGCAWVTDGEREGHGLSSGFTYPPDCREPALLGQEPIGALFDALWRDHRDAQAIAESGRQEGNIGKLTGGRLTRSAYGTQAVLCALVPFLHVDLYD